MNEERPELRWMAIGDLLVDRRYQRAIESRRSEALIARIAEGFDWARFQVVTVAAYDGGFYVADGQHRVEGARRAGVAEVPCVVVRVADAAAAAATFIAVNRERVTVTPLALHHALVAQGDRMSLEIDALCRAAGIEVARYPTPADRLRPGVTLALGTLRRCLRTFGRDTAEAALTALARGVEGRAGALRAERIQGAAHALRAGMGAAAIERRFAETADDWLDGHVRQVYARAEIPQWQIVSAWLRGEKLDLDRVAASSGHAASALPPPRPDREPGQTRIRQAAHGAGRAEGPVETAGRLAVTLNRRCDCGAVFKTDLAARTRCDRCEAPSIRAKGATQDERG